MIPISSESSRNHASVKNSLSSTFPPGNAQKFGHALARAERFIRRMSPPWRQIIFADAGISVRVMEELYKKSQKNQILQ